MTETRARQKVDARKTAAERMQSDIKAGKVDGDLAQIVEAVQARIANASMRVQWRAQLDGFDVSETTLTLDEAYRIEQETGTNWQNIEPLRSAGDARGILTVLLQTRKGMSEPEAADRVGNLTVIETLDALSTEVMPGPLDTESSTSTS